MPKFTDLPTAAALTGSEVINVVQPGTPSGTSVQTPVSAVKTFVGGVSVNAQTGTSYTLAASDNGNVVTFNSGSPVTLTCPPGLGIFSCLVIQKGLGQVAVVAGGGVTVNSFGSLTHLAGQYAMVTIIADVANAFVLGGQLA